MSVWSNSGSTIIAPGFAGRMAAASGPAEIEIALQLEALQGDPLDV